MNLSILIATHNRADGLRDTLWNLARLETSNLSAQFVVIDNNSSDATRDVVRSMMPELNLRYGFEKRQGKNHALNKALETVELGDLVVFTDDDVNPDRDWLQEIVASCITYKEVSVFGGRVIPCFADQTLPQWTNDPFIRSHVFTEHGSVAGSCATEYRSGSYPIGPNFWIRREIIERGYRFNPAIGPRPYRRIMGSETSFLHMLRSDGYAMLHIPTAVVRHRIKKEEVSLRHVRRRLRLRGQSAPLATRIRHDTLFENHPWIWRSRRGLSMARWFFRAITAWVPSPNSHLIGRLGRAYMGLHVDWAELRMSFTTHRHPSNDSRNPNDNPPN